MLAIDHRRVLAASLSLFLSFLAVACTPRQSPEQALEQRATEYWKARALNDLATMYKMESDALPGGTLTPQKMTALLGVPVRNVTVISPEVKGDKGTVKVKAQVAVGQLGWMPQEITDPWVRIDGEWYHKRVKHTGLAEIVKKWREKEAAQDRAGTPPAEATPKPAAAPADDGSLPEKPSGPGADGQGVASGPSAEEPSSPPPGR